MSKIVVYYIDRPGCNPVWDFIRSLSPVERNKCLEYIAYLEEVGENVRRPVGDYLGDKLYELRPKQTRMIYFFMQKNYAVLVHAFRKKTAHLPAKDLAIASRRRVDFMQRYERGEIILEGEK